MTGLAAGQRWSDHVAALWCMGTCSPHVVGQLNDAGFIRSRSTYYRCFDSRPHSYAVIFNKLDYVVNK